MGQANLRRSFSKVKQVLPGTSQSVSLEEEILPDLLTSVLLVMGFHYTTYATVMMTCTEL